MNTLWRGAWCGFAGCCLLVAALAAQQQPTVEFEDPDLPARSREFLQRWATTVRAWAMVQRVVQEVREQNADAPTPERVREVDEAWRAGRDPGNLPQKLASNPCARALQAVMAGNSSVSEIRVSDARGVLVCATGRTAGYDHAGDADFQKALAGGVVHISRAAFDEEAGADVVRVSVPVMDGGKPIGVLTASRLLIGS